MRYWYPFTSDALEAVKRDGIERLVVLPLYPQAPLYPQGLALLLPCSLTVLLLTTAVLHLHLGIELARA